MARILFVDDDRLSMKMVRTLLENNGDEIITACDGAEGLQKARSEKLDLIILDVMMPKINGLEVCRTLKEDYRYNKIPIIILSSMSKEKDIRAGKEAGADAYLKKPYDSTILLHTIDELLESHKSAYL